MRKLYSIGTIIFLSFWISPTRGQSVDSVADKVLNFPSRLFKRIQSRTASLNQDLSSQTEKYLEKMMKQEQRMQKRLAAVDSNGATLLFARSQQQYATLIARLKTDTGNCRQLASLSGTYQPYVDSLQGSLAFLQRNPQLLNSAGLASAGNGPQLTQLQGATGELQAYQAKMQDAASAQAFIQQRKQQIAQYLSTHANVQNLLKSPMDGLNRQAYYYSQQLREYREMWDNPDKLEQQMLAVVNRLPAFQSFMKNNSQLGSLFSLPSSYGSPAGLSGLQTRDQVSQEVQSHVPTGASGGLDALQSNLQSAQSQLDGYKQRLSQLGSGNGNVDMPNFKPNDQKTKTFWKRLEYGANFQTTHNNYYFPMVTDLGLLLGYKLGHDNVVGVGASYKLGWGNGIQHIAFTSQGVGLRSFLQIKIKGTFSATGGFEYNYTTPFISYQQLKQMEYWTKSGLIGVTKTVSMKSRFLKKSTLSLLWDFLSYQQVPQTQPILFRIGYTL